MTLCLLQVSAWAGAAEIAGVQMKERAMLGASQLVLNGAGVRTRMAVKVYVAGFYLPEKRTSSEDAFAFPGPKRISIAFLRDVPAPKLVAALNQGIRSNCSDGEAQALQTRLEELAATLLALRQGRKGDVVTFDWLPDSGTRVGLNGHPVGEPIVGPDLYRALLRVWLGDRPTSRSLKRALLGQAH